MIHRRSSLFLLRKTSSSIKIKRFVRKNKREYAMIKVKRNEIKT